MKHKKLLIVVVVVVLILVAAAIGNYWATSRWKSWVTSVR